MGEVTTHIPPRYLYRFRSAASKYFLEEMDRAINFSELYFVPLKKLNDPFEALPFYKRNTIKEIRDYLKAFENFFGKGISITGINMKEVLSVTSPDKKIRDALIGTGVAHAKEIEKIMYKAAERLRVATKATCFSTYWQSLLMWSHYASGHNGVCMEYETYYDGAALDCNTALCMTYVEKRPTISTVELLEHVASASCGGGATFFDKERIDRTFEAIALTKAKDWSYEHEWRYSVIDDEPEGYRRVNALKPASILVGANVSKEVTDELKARYGGKIPIEKLALDDQDFMLRRKDIASKP